MSLVQIIWNPDEYMIDLGFFAVRYYSLCFLLAFILSFFVLKRNFIKRQISIQVLESLTIYIFLGTLIGARLGHCLFYDFAYYSFHPLEIILPITFEPHFKFIGFQGLASHGGGLGIVISLILFSRKNKMNLWFLLDQVALVVPLAGFFIRIGNLMNSEIIGKPTNVSWAFIFVKEDELPRHPAQLYEAIAYLFIFAILYFLMNKFPQKAGFNFGFCLVLIFTIRFLLEFIKENQSAFEAGLSLNMGQLLSIPYIIAGLFFIYIRNHLKLRSTFY